MCVWLSSLNFALATAGFGVECATTELAKVDSNPYKTEGTHTLLLCPEL